MTKKKQTSSSTGTSSPKYNENQRTVGQQTVSNDRTYVSPSILAYHKLETEDFAPVFYKPHTLISLTLLLLLLNTFAYTDILSNLAYVTTAATNTSGEAFSSDEHAIGTMKNRGAVIGVVVAFIAFGSIHMPNTIIRRPHPIFWRVGLTLFLIYALFMTYLFMLPIEEARQVLRYFDTNLGQAMPERSYADDCRVHTPEHPTSQYANISEAVFDVHFVAHLLGWWGKMMIMRDWYVAWACSILFELLEITFKHWLPNFEECWWDQLFLDLFGCNFLGIILGYFTLKYFGAGRINWVYRPPSASSNDKNIQTYDSDATCTNMIQNVFNKLRPGVFEKYDWAVFRDVRHYVGAWTFVAVCLVIDCNNFFLKSLIWIPAEHDLLKFRVALWGLVAMATGKEWYEFIQNDYCHRLGPFAWLTFYVSAIEMLTVVKFQGDTFQEPFPFHVKCIWSVIGTFWLIGLLIAFMNGQKNAAEAARKGEKFNPYNPAIEVIKHGKKNN